MKETQSLIAALAGLDVDIDQEVASRLLWFRDELLRWNRKINLTAIRDPLVAREKHLVDSLSLVPLLQGQERLLDIGSGGGFPGVPLQLVLPGLQVVSVDAVGKKIGFQRHVARLLNLPGFTAWHGRAEQLPQQPFCQGGFDVVVSRAFADISTFVRLALPCLAPGGRIIAMKGAEGEAELAAAHRLLEQCGIRVEKVHRLSLPESGAQRTLLVLTRN